MNVLGLRIGNTNTSAFVTTSEHPEPRLVEFEGEPLLPTAAVLREDDTAVVGKPALDYQWENPDALFLNLPKAIQQKEILKFLPPNFTELSVSFIKKIRLCSECLINNTIDHCILVVPVGYDLFQNNILKAAVDEAGLIVKETIPYPEAAVLGAELPEKPSLVLVIRMGGTSTGITLLRRQSPWEIISHHEDLHLGGQDIDEMVIKWYLGKQPDSKISPSARQSAEQARISLSTSYQARFLSAEISRQEFERLITPLLQRVYQIVDSTLNHAKEQGFSRKDLDLVLLTGGCAHIPVLKQVLEDCLEKEIVIPMDPDLVAARGAAIKGRDIN